MTIRRTVTAGRSRPGGLGSRIAVAVVLVTLATTAPSYAQHGNYLLGTNGLLGGSQAPEGIYYQNIFSYYSASGPLLDASTVREIEGHLGRPIGSLSASGQLDASLLSKAQLVEAFQEGFDANVKEQTAPKAAFERMLTLVPDVKEGSTLTFTYCWERARRSLPETRS